MPDRSDRPGRGLGEVLHHFISEEEQAEARERSAQKRAPRRPARTAVEPSSPPQSTRAWCLVASPARPLQGALILDLALALADETGPVTIVTSRPSGPLRPNSQRVRWRELEGTDESVRAAAAAGALRDGARLLVIAPEELGPILSGLPEGALAGVIVPVDTASRRQADALHVLRELRAGPGRIGILFLSSGEPTATLFQRLHGAAGRQLGVQLEHLGTIERDNADFRSLLAGSSILESDPAAPSALALGRIAQELRKPEQVVGA